MKIVCDFCKTEYNTERTPTMPVKCAICGHTWTVRGGAPRNTWLLFVAAVCALLSAIVFSVVMVTHHQISEIKNQPLVANVDTVSTVTDALGTAHFVVSGHVLNRSDAIYGVPDLIIVMWDGDDKIISQQKFMPSATLLDAGGRAEFSHTLSAPTTGVKKITAKLAMDDGDAQ